jgi:O-antigen ligase
LAILLGLAAAGLPPRFTALLLAAGILLLAVYLEPTLGLVIVLAVAPLKTLLETETSFNLPLDIGQLALVGFLGVYFLRYVVDGAAPLRVPILLLAGIAVFVVGAGLSLWASYSASGTIKELLKWIQVLLLVLVVANTGRWLWVVFGIVLSAALQAVIGLWEFQGGSGAAHLWILDFRYFRAFGTFGQPNPFGTFMGMTLPLAVGASLGFLWAAVRHDYKKPQRDELWVGLVFAGMAMLIAAGLMASWSRGAWLGFMGAMAVLAWSLPRPQWIGNIAVIGGASAVILLASLGMLPAAATNRLTSFTQDFTGFRDVRGEVISNDNFAVVERLAHWQSAIDMAETNPWLGVGFGNYEVAYPEYALINWPNALGHAHNYYLNLLAETGMIGLLAYLIMWGVIAGSTWRLLATDDWRLRGIAAGLLGTWTHISIHSLLDNLYVNNMFLHIGAMIGLVAALELMRKGDGSRNPAQHD